MVSGPALSAEMFESWTACDCGNEVFIGSAVILPSSDAGRFLEVVKTSTELSLDVSIVRSVRVSSYTHIVRKCIFDVFSVN